MNDALWSLPGPSRLTAGVADALTSNASCVVVAPQPLRMDSEWVYGLVAATGQSIEVIEPEGDRPPASVLADRFGVTWRAGDGAAAAMVQELAGYSNSVLGMSLGPDDQTWAAFVASFLEALPAIPEVERPQVLVLCGPNEVSTFRTRRLPLQERWWWGAVDRLDTTVWAMNALGDRADPITISSLTEVCGFDLAFVEVLAQDWGGSLDQLAYLVAEGTRQESHHCEWSILSQQLTTGTTPARFQEDWDRGLVCAWDRYQPFVSPIALPPETRSETLRTRLWRGQLRELMPLVDEERARLETWVQSGRVSEEGLSHPIEIGYLTKLLHEDPSLRKRASPVRRQAARWLRDTRNVLAHRDIMEPEEITRGLALLDEDRRARGNR